MICLQGSVIGQKKHPQPEPKLSMYCNRTGQFQKRHKHLACTLKFLEKNIPMTLKKSVHSQKRFIALCFGKDPSYKLWSASSKSHKPVPAQLLSLYDICSSSGVVDFTFNLLSNCQSKLNNNLYLETNVLIQHIIDT